MSERLKTYGRRGIIIAGVAGGLRLLDRTVSHSLLAPEKESLCEIEVNVAFEPHEDPELEMVWVKEGQDQGEYPEENKVNWYEFVGQLECPMQAVKINLVGDGHPEEISYQPMMIDGKETTLIWVKRYESGRGDVPYQDERLQPFYTRPGDYLGTPAGFWIH